MIGTPKPTAVAAVIALIFVTPVSAQSLTWLDILSPDRVIQAFARYGIIMARTQVDMTFDDISTNLRSNRTTISNLRMWPATPWRDNQICRIDIERITINGQAFDNLDNVVLRIDAFDTVAEPGCFPPELRPVLGQLNVDKLSLPSIGANVDYHIPSSRAQVSILASMTDVAEVTVAADFDYVSVRTRGRRSDPVPIVVLSSASAALHNLGGWEVLSHFIPAAFTDEQSAAGAVEAVLRTAFTELNRKSFDRVDDELSVVQLALISSMTTAWTDFLKSPDQLVLETNISPDRAAFLNFLAYENNPSWIVRDLNPVMRAAVSPLPETLPIEFIDAAISGAWGDLPETERLRTGLALARGEGATRNPGLATEILGEFAEGGNIEAVTAMAEILEPTDPEAAYIWSLRAGAAGVSGAAARLDRLEGEISLSTILQIQSEAAENPLADTNLPRSIVGIRSRARDHLTGIGSYRNYQAAHTWASVGATMNDPASIALGTEIAKTLDAAQSPNAKATVVRLRQQANGDALELWAELMRILERPQRPVASARTDIEADTVAATDEGPGISAEDLENCRQILTDRVRGTFEVGGSCTANNAVLLRELAVALRQRDDLRMSGASRADEPQPAATVETDNVRPATAPEPDAITEQIELPLERPVARPAESADIEAALAAGNSDVETALATENEVLRSELAANAAELVEGERRVELLNQQVAALRTQLSSLQAMLDEAAGLDAENQVRIEALGSQLNTALARVAAEERRRAELAEDQARRLAEEAARAPSDVEMLERVRDELLADLRGILANGSDVTVASDRVIVPSGTLFRSGSTTLSPEGRAQLSDIMQRFVLATQQIPASVDWILRVDGHTDDVPISSGAFADNWELSQARALSVVRFLTEEGAVPPNRLAAVGFGEFRPVNPEPTSAARSQNRRIELLLTTQ